MVTRSKEKKRDDREFDTTSLHEKMHGRNLHRDYTAHFFRWNFARRFINKTSNVLEIGCGVEKPLAHILSRNALQQVNEYVGVDLNPLTENGYGRRYIFHGEFNFIKDWKKLKRTQDDGFDVVLHLEVIEHMAVPHGRALLKGCFELLKPGGVMLMSTPCYDGHRHAANHIHEYTVEELQKAVIKAGFTVERRFGTFMDVRHITKVKNFDHLPADTPYDDSEVAAAVQVVHDLLHGYYDRDALSCFFAPLFPDHARNNLWVCRKPGGA
jgi:2-polyprenyl-3-methyl-5-hydroxy-6-metoxy-1,4-benzoquinol methylase